MRKLELAALLVVFCVPLISLAFVGVPFGGRVLATVPCTCTGGAIITYAAFFTVGHFPSTAVSLYYQFPVSVTFRNIPAIPSSWEVGSFIPSLPGAPSICMVGVPPACAPDPTPVFGYISVLGSSLPTFK